MIEQFNKFIAKNGMWIFLGAATYKFVFYVINLVYAFQGGASRGVRTLFDDLLGMALELIILGVVLELSRKLAGNTVSAPTNYGYTAQNNYAAQTAQAPRPVQAPQAQSVPTPTANSGAWFCSSCGTQNVQGAGFCSKCGKPKQ